MYADVVFPLKLPPLTYKVPDNSPHDLKGRIVKAQLMGKSHYGLVVSTNEELSIERGKSIKEIQSAHQIFATESALSFLKWLSDYYLTPTGIALKSSFFEEVVKILGSHEVRSQDINHQTLNTETQILNTELRTQNPELKPVYNSIKDKTYRTFLFHAPSISHEYSLLSGIFKADSDIRNAIILVPEIGQIERLSSLLRDILGERLCILHSKLTKKKLIEAVKRIITGQSDIIVGTRSAILCPLKHVSFIVVMDEHSPSYKGEEGLRYNARDVAVMRGFIEKSCVLLSSVTPSVESVYNAKIGKYSILEHRSQESEDGCHGFKRPVIKIIDAGKEKSSISADIIKKAKNVISKNGRFLFLVNRKGYSLIGCNDCGYIFKCKNCNVSVVLYKGKSLVKCHYCGYEGKVPESCKECKGFNIKPVGVGTERIKEELEEAMKTEIGLNSLNALNRNISDIVQIVQKVQPAGGPLSLDPDVTPFIVGTGYASRKFRSEAFEAAAFLNVDMLLSQPDFRAYERTFQEIMQISQMVKKEGYIYLQTHSPKNKILRFIKNYDFYGFHEYELSQRKALDYPPFSRIILFNIFPKKHGSPKNRKIFGSNSDVQKFLQDIQKIIENTNVEGIEILGPVAIPFTLKSQKHCLQILLKSKDRKSLHETARELLLKLKQLKGIKINIDVDPLKI